MSDQNANVHLSITSDAKGAEQHADALKKVATAQTQTAEATKKDTAATKEATQTKKGLVDALKQLRQEVPAVNIAILAMKNPWVAITAAAVGTMTAISNKIAQLNAVVAQAKFFTEWQTIETRFANVRERSNEMAEAFKKDMEAMKQSAKETSDAISESLKTISENSQWETAALEMDKKKAVAKAKLRGAGPTEIAQIEAGFDARKIEIGQRKTIDEQEEKAKGALALEAKAEEAKAKAAGLGDKSTLKKQLAELNNPAVAVAAAAAKSQATKDLEAAQLLELEGKNLQAAGVGLPISYAQGAYKLSEAKKLRESSTRGFNTAGVHEARVNQLTKVLGSIDAAEGEAKGFQGQADDAWRGIAAESARMPGRFRGEWTNFATGQAVDRLGREQAQQDSAVTRITGSSSAEVENPSLDQALRQLAASKHALSGLANEIIADGIRTWKEIENLKNQLKAQQDQINRGKE